MRRLTAWGLAVTTVFLLAGDGPSPAAQAAGGEALTVGAAINIAGRQRMLSQRLAKAWIMTGIGIAPGRAGTILTESQSRFEAQLAELENFVPNDDVREALVRIGREWRIYKATLAAAPRPDTAQRVYESSETVQNEAHRLTLAYEKSARGPPERLINIAGRQRMLSQRLAKFYLFIAWGANPMAARMELNFARAEFSSGMHQLYNTPDPDPETRRLLQQLDSEWVGYRELLATPRAEAAYRRGAPQVAELSERILVTIEALVERYEQRARTGTP